MTEVKIPEQRYISLVEHEREASNMLESIVKWIASTSFLTDKKELEKHINIKLREMGITYKGEQAQVWFAMGGVLLYWNYSNSKSIRID